MSEDSNLRADNEILRKQVLAYQQDLETCRKVFFYITNKLKDATTFEAQMVRNAAARCLKEMKQR